MVITIFTSVAAAQQQGIHINVELLKQMLGLRAQAVLVLFGLVCSGALFLLMGYFGWFATFRSFGSGEIRQGQLGFPVWPARLTLALGSSLMVLQCLMQFISTSRALLSGKVANAVVAPAADLRIH